MDARRISDEDHLEKLTALKQEKAAMRAALKSARTAKSAPEPFEPYFIDADVIRARGLGIRLD